MIICKCALLPRLRVTGSVRGVRAYPGPVTHVIICKCALLPRLRVTGLVRGVRAYPGPVTHAILGQTFSMIIVTCCGLSDPRLNDGDAELPPDIISG